jgi:hypothetical protein
MKSARFGVAGTPTTTALPWPPTYPRIALICGFLAETSEPPRARGLPLFGVGVTTGLQWMRDEMGAL